MKLVTQCRAILVAKEATPSADGKNIYYKIAILQGTDANTASCTKEVFDAEPQLFKEYEFDLKIGEYNNEATYRIVGIRELPTTHTTDPIGANRNVTIPSGDNKK